MPPLDPARERNLLFTLATIQFAHILDFMIMMPLGPVLMRELQIDAQQFGLLVSSYTFAAALAAMPMAAMADRFERKRLLLAMFALFGLATLACALAADYAQLLTARAIAGAFGGILGALVQTMVGDLIPFERRGRASGILMSAFSLSTVAGVPASLLLANAGNWRWPFFFIAALASVFILLGSRQLPSLRSHLHAAASGGESAAHPLAALAIVLGNRDHLRAFLFMALTIFSGFAVIPYITVYLTANGGVAQAEIPYLYLAGGCATWFTSRWIGRRTDAWGKVRTYRRIALVSLLPLYALTHLPPLPLWAVLLVSTAFFVLVPGRMVPVMAIMTSAMPAHVRGTFLVVNAAVQNLCSGVAAYLGGSLIVVAHGRVDGYGNVGWLAIGMTLVAMWLAGRLRLYSASGVQPMPPQQPTARRTQPFS